MRKICSPQFFWILWTHFEPVELMDQLREYLSSGLVSIYFTYLSLVAVQDVNAFDDLSRVILEEKEEELILIVIRYVYEFSSLSSIQLPLKTCVCNCVHHDLYICLLLEWVLTIDWDNLWVCIVPTFLPLQFVTISCKDALQLIVPVQRWSKICLRSLICLNSPYHV